ncbi:MAG: portal protein [Candidatus Tisiphia sp.]
MAHFGMRSVPQLKDLPTLHESLGKIVSLKDIEGLTLGLPSMTAASGKKYNYEVLYDNEFIKKLKKVSKKLGEPYLNTNSTINPNTTRSNYNTNQQQLTSAELNILAQMLEKAIMDIFNNPVSNFYNQIHQFLLNLAAFGTAIFYVEEDL